jgi:phosphatidylethanolamine/phosphatidyl-N-methylethanolamine N-methyltransferase
LSLKHSYTLIAPFYDAFLTHATHGARRRSLAALADLPPQHVLLLGVGTGLDLPLLPPQHHYVGIDLTGGMLRKSLPRARGLRFAPVRGDVQLLPFADASMDSVVLHLILAVVPAPTFCLREAVRVLRPGGQLLVFDKFLRRGEFGWKRWLNPLTRQVATRLDVVFEDVLAEVGGLDVRSDQPALASGWFRLIRLSKPTFSPSAE